jgi:hypothetical protein
MEAPTMNALDNYPTIRLVLRSLLAGLGTFLGYLYATGYDSMSTGDWVDATVIGLISAIGFSGISATTPIDKSIGATGRGGGNKL